MKKQIKWYISIAIVVTIVLILGKKEYISLSPKDSKIGNNTQLRDMFQSEARSAGSHQKAAEKNWSDKYFNIKTD